MAFVVVLLSGLDHIYLKESNMFSVNGSNSNLLSIACGVSQGSVLGPLLFLIYIHDLLNVPKKLTFYLIADDTNIYCESKNVSDLKGLFHPGCLARVISWLAFVRRHFRGP